jgi:endonuclease YncB( thermonuclease family)
MLYSSITSHPQRRNLIPIELAGISHPPLPAFGGMSHEGMGLLHQLVQNKTRVSIQLLAQRANVSCLSSSRVSEKEEDGARLPISDDILQSTAICHVTYRTPKQWFQTTNVSLELVASGQALLSSCVVPQSSDNSDDETKIINFDPTPKHLQNDAAFMTQLEEAEYTAWKSKLGVWSLEEMRELRMEYKQEEDYISNRWSTRVWNALKSGWRWIRK